MATTADFRNGLCLEFNNDLFVITEFQHVKPGKGNAFVRTKLKSLKTGRTLDNTFPAGVKIDIARIERRQYQYLYQEGDGYNFMNNETFEQILLVPSLINAPQFLIEGQMCDITFHADTETPLACELPPFVEMEITYAEPGLKGDTATRTLKAATVSSGATVYVPLFVNTGERIRIDTRTGDYSERVK